MEPQTRAEFLQCESMFYCLHQQSTLQSTYRNDSHVVLDKYISTISRCGCFTSVFVVYITYFLLSSRINGPNALYLVDP